VDVEVTWRGRPFEGAKGQRKADKFQTEGVNVRARKPPGAPGPARGDA